MLILHSIIFLIRELFSRIYNQIDLKKKRKKKRIHKRKVEKRINLHKFSYLKRKKLKKKEERKGRERRNKRLEAEEHKNWNVDRG